MPRCTVLLFAALVLLATPVHAQYPPGLAMNMRLALASGPGSNYDLHSPYGWVVPGPFVDTLAANSGGGNAYANGSFIESVDYGRIHLAGSASYLCGNGNGDVCFFSQYTGGAHQGEYRDRIYLGSASLPIGAPVTLQLTARLTGSAVVIDVSPTRAIGVGLQDDGHSGSVATLADTGSTGFTETLSIGDSLQLHGWLDADLECGHAGLGTGSGTITCDLLGTYQVTSLTPGVVLSSNSGTVGVPDVPGEAAALALTGAVPNPARPGTLMLRFALPDGASAVLSLYDLAGREVAREDVGTFGAGAHVVDLARGRTLAPGVYLARLSRGTEARTARVAIVR